MTRRERYARAFYRQARADFATFERLSRIDDSPLCHRLHFLQMACEKLSKAYLWRTSAADPEHLTTSHAHVRHSLPLIAREVYRRSRSSPPGDHSAFMKRVTHLARQIELLAPAVDDDGKRPDNCEYPWEQSDGTVLVPADYSFPNMSLLHGDPAGIQLVRFMLPFAFSGNFELFD